MTENRLLLLNWDNTDMTETPKEPSQNSAIHVVEDAMIKQKKIAMLVYGLFSVFSLLFSVYTFILPIVGVMVAHIKKSESSDFIYSHFKNQIYTFWTGISFLITIGIVRRIAIFLVSIPDDSDIFYGLEGQDKLEAMNERILDLKISISRMETINTIGYSLTFAASIWILYRCVRGILRLMENKSY